ncbi:hypothetical protein AX774_g7840 [Zancudomyces culisetae]|uniref:Uncharacterized protein n=1 Tax=Zancudomyces culisetae TaxID=1213189 RepID=A0A1R1PCR4_ZANCU|nr:hypothetical protein AX774_g7840 [Zancudomyces culisetae]|eukprot:OMH78764.1 hypothetical protein AX774_g7840 [Zancudomyces culisetae]
MSVFEHVKVIVKSRKSKYRLPQVYFMLVYKSKEVFDSKQRKNTRILPLGVGRYNDEEKVKTAINALNTQFMDLKVSNSEKIVGNFGSCSGTDYGIVIRKQQ